MQNFTPSNTPSGQEFVYFFHKKIETVRIRRQVGPTGPARPTTFLVPTATTLNTFQQYTEKDIAAPSKSFKLDPLPTDILKHFLSDPLPFVTQMCN